MKEGRNSMTKWLQTSIKGLSYGDAVNYRDAMVVMGVNNVSTIQYMTPKQWMILREFHWVLLKETLKARADTTRSGTHGPRRIETAGSGGETYESRKEGRGAELMSDMNQAKGAKGEASGRDKEETKDKGPYEDKDRTEGIRGRDQDNGDGII